MGQRWYNYSQEREIRQNSEVLHTTVITRCVKFAGEIPKVLA